VRGIVTCRTGVGANANERTEPSDAPRPPRRVIRTTPRPRPTITRRSDTPPATRTRPPPPAHDRSRDPLDRSNSNKCNGRDQPPMSFERAQQLAGDGGDHALSTAVYKTLIRGYAARGEWDALPAVFARAGAQAPPRGVEPRVTFAALADAAGEHGWPQCLQVKPIRRHVFRQSVPRLRVACPPRWCNTAPLSLSPWLSPCRWCVVAARARQLFERMVREGLAGTDEIEGFVGALSESRQYARALGAFERAQAATTAAAAAVAEPEGSATGVGGGHGSIGDGTSQTAIPIAATADTKLYTKLIAAAGRLGRWERALELLADMRARRVHVDVIAYTAAITACQRCGQWREALALFEQMKAHGQAPNKFTYASLIAALEKGGRWRKALATFEDMQVSVEDSIHERPKTSVSFLTGKTVTRSVIRTENCRGKE
jgi:pentatricopeptide repeat protein